MPQHFQFRLFSSVLAFICCLAPAYSSQFRSDIFQYDNPTEGRGLQVHLQGEGWSAEDIKEPHIGFHQQDIFGDSKVMKRFGNGQVRDPAVVQARCYEHIERYANGHPHGMMVVINPHTGEPFMHVVGGGGDRWGTSEIAFASVNDTKYRKKGFGGNVVKALVETWAPEVRQIGLGSGLDEIADLKIIERFRCFEGEIADKKDATSGILNQLDATSSPSNVASWKILDRLNFTAAVCSVEESDIKVNYEDHEFDGKNPYKLMEGEICKLFNPQYTPSPLPGGKRIKMIDIDGKERTFSFHLGWGRPKYHFETKID